MVDVTRSNFLEIFPKIEYAIKAADFIAIDTEFTGLRYDDSCAPSLFDSSKQRYKKLKKSVENFTLSQIGVTTFKGNISENRYYSETFNFYLCPIPMGSCDQRFSMQWLYEGIPFLNQVEEKQILSDIESGHPLNGMESNVDEERLQGLCSFVASWLPNKAAGDCVVVPIAKDEPMTAMYIYQADLRKRFSQIWTSVDPFGQVVVKRVNTEERERLEFQSKDSDKKQREQQILEMLGFTRVFRLMTGLSTPIVGHNLLMDLIFMYDKFHQPLPESYVQFKQDLHKLFPNVYDTKHIYHCLRQRLEPLKSHSIRDLHDLYNVLHSPSMMSMTLMQPSVERVDWTGHQALATEQIHQAGFDAFMCGSSFLRICHLLHFRNVHSMDVEACSFQAYLITMRNFCNCVNVIRAMVNNIKLDGEEPPSQRPPLIHVEAVRPRDSLMSHQLYTWFSMYGTVDIQMINQRQAVVATSNFMTARDIISQFNGHKFIKVSKYKFWEHSPLGQNIVLGSLVVATGSCILLLINAFK